MDSLLYLVDDLRPAQQKKDMKDSLSRFVFFDESWNGCDLEILKRFQPHLDAWKSKYRQICSQNRYPNFEIMTRCRFLKEFELRFSEKEIWRKSSCQDHIYFIRIQDGFIVYDSPLDFKDSQGFKNTWGLWTVRDSVFPVFQVASISWSVTKDHAIVIQGQNEDVKKHSGNFRNLQMLLLGISFGG